MSNSLVGCVYTLLETLIISNESDGVHAQTQARVKHIPDTFLVNAIVRFPVPFPVDEKER